MFLCGFKKIGVFFGKWVGSEFEGFSYKYATFEHSLKGDQVVCQGQTWSSFEINQQQFSIRRGSKENERFERSLEERAFHELNGCCKDLSSNRKIYFIGKSVAINISQFSVSDALIVAEDGSVYFTAREARFDLRFC